jgi:hypothetical protein
MSRTALLASAFGVILLCSPVEAMARSALSKADQQRVVCLPERDGAGQPTGTQRCMTGRGWELTLAQYRRAQYEKAERTQTGDNNSSYLAYRSYFSLKPGI